MSDDSNLKGSVLNAEGAKLVRPNAFKKIRAGIVVLGASMVILLLNGCASAPVQQDSDPWKYNPNTSYPAVGAAGWWRP